MWKQVQRMVGKKKNEQNYKIIKGNFLNYKIKVYFGKLPLFSYFFNSIFNQIKDKNYYFLFSKLAWFLKILVEYI